MKFANATNINRKSGKEGVMRTLILFLLTASMAFAQETRRTATLPSPNPADDTKQNSPQVPDVYAVTGHFDRVVVLRFKYKTDLLAGLQKDGEAGEYPQRGHSFGHRIGAGLSGSPGE